MKLIDEFSFDALKKLWPYNLIYEIMKEYSNSNEMPEQMFNISIDKLGEAFDTLCERERTVILSRFKYGYTFKKIGEDMHISGTRVSQICSKGLRKMRHPSRRNKYIAVSQYEYNELNNKLHDAKFEIVQLNHSIRKLEGVEDEPEEEITIPLISLTEFRNEISVRTYNCLKGSGIKTTSDLQSKNMCQLAKIRNMGLKSIEEIFMFVKYHNLKLAKCYKYEYFNVSEKVLQMYIKIFGEEPWIAEE